MVETAPEGSAPNGGWPHPQWIDDATALRSACRRWLPQPALGIDTEFVRERTFFPALGLIQIADREATTLIDPIAVEDLAPLWEVLQSPQVLKIFHSCSEDLEVLYHRFGSFPTPIFDTQIAASLAGVGHSLGYARLVDALFGIEIPKGQTRTNWLKRPLTEAQIRYAALDVAHLPPAHERLHHLLREQGRDSWAAEAFAQLPDAERFLPDPRHAYLRLRAHRSLSRRELGRLQALCAWREQTARDRNVPRNFVLKDSVLSDLARRSAPQVTDLAGLGLKPHEIRRYGSTLCRIVSRADRLRPSQLPQRSERKADISKHKEHVDQLRAEVRRIAEELNIAPEFLATRRAIEEVVRRRITGKSPTMPEELSGWRQTVLEGRLIPLIESIAT